jgi:hypothetical protein
METVSIIAVAGGGAAETLVDVAGAQAANAANEASISVGAMRTDCSSRVVLTAAK